MWIKPKKNTNLRNIYLILSGFRYECEGRSAGALHGVNYNPDNKTYPSIQIIGYK